MDQTWMSMVQDLLVLDIKVSRFFCVPMKSDLSIVTVDYIVGRPHLPVMNHLNGAEKARVETISSHLLSLQSNALCFSHLWA